MRTAHSERADDGSTGLRGQVLVREDGKYEHNDQSVQPRHDAVDHLVYARASIGARVAPAGTRALDRGPAQKQSGPRNISNGNSPVKPLPSDYDETSPSEATHPAQVPDGAASPNRFRGCNEKDS